VTGTVNYTMDIGFSHSDLGNSLLSTRSRPLLFQSKAMPSRLSLRQTTWQRRLS
jgi:hypothetical protein